MFERCLLRRPFREPRSLWSDKFIDLRGGARLLYFFIMHVGEEIDSRSQVPVFKTFFVLWVLPKKVRGLFYIHYNLQQYGWVPTPDVNSCWCWGGSVPRNPTYIHNIVYVFILYGGAVENKAVFSNYVHYICAPTIPEVAVPFQNTCVCVRVLNVCSFNLGSFNDPRSYV